MTSKRDRVNENEQVRQLLSEGYSRREFLDQMAKGGLALAGMMAMPNIARSMVSEDGVVRIGYLPITDATALLVAHGKGFLEEEGLKVERPTLIRGWSPLVEGFASGKFNLVHFLKPIPVWMRYNLSLIHI